MRKKQIQQVIDGHLVSAEKEKEKGKQCSRAKVSKTNHKRMRQREWDYAALDIEAFQHFKSL